MAEPRKPKAVVLLSAGLDSTFNLYKARQEFEVGLALTFSYGQRAARRELAAAERLAETLQVAHEVIELPWFKTFTRTSLVTGSGIPLGTDVEINSLPRSLETAKSVWVPNRNGIFLNIAAGFAEGLGATVVVPGFNAEEAQTFPDNSAGYLKALDSAFEYSTATHVRTRCYSIEFTKPQIVKEALALNLPLADLWPCYLDDELWCGECESCQRFARALKENHLSFEELRSRR